MTEPRRSPRNAWDDPRAALILLVGSVGSGVAVLAAAPYLLKLIGVAMIVAGLLMTRAVFSDYRRGRSSVSEEVGDHGVRRRSSAMGLVAFAVAIASSVGAAIIVARGSRWLLPLAALLLAYVGSFVIRFVVNWRRMRGRPHE